MKLLPDFPAARLVKVAGGTLSVAEQQGDGPPLVLLHGFTDCADSFRLLLPYLAGQHLVIPDLRGHGQSFRDPQLTLSDFAQDIAGLLDALNLRQVCLVGHSMGTLIALTLTGLRPDRVAGLVLLSPSLRPAGPAMSQLRNCVASLPEPLSPTDPFFTEWYHGESPLPQGFTTLLAHSASAMRRSDWTAILQNLETTDLTNAARAIALPVLALSGQKDPIFPPEHHHHLIETLQPEMHEHWPDCGHNPHWERPQAVARALLGFRQTLPRGRRHAPFAVAYI